MRGFLCCTALMCLLSVSAAAEPNGDRLPASEGSAYETDPRVGEATLQKHWVALGESTTARAPRRMDTEALAIAKQWESGADAPPPAVGENGRIEYVFGTPAKLICAPLRVCTIELQAGEMIQSRAKAGDTSRWIVTPARSGMTTYVAVKPTAANISTNLVIFTDRRVYHLDLESKLDEHMAFVSFSYPEDQRSAWESYMQDTRTASTSKASERASAKEDVPVNSSSYYWGYSISKEGACHPWHQWIFSFKTRCKWAPLRAYDDGRKTTIEMPSSMERTEAPVLFVREGGEDVIVDFELRGRKFIVDQIVTEGVLIKGVGRKQERIVITRKEE